MAGNSGSVIVVPDLHYYSRLATKMRVRHVMMKMCWKDGAMTETTQSNEVFEEGLMTVAEASKFLSIGKSKLYELMDAGQLVYAKFGKARRIPKRALVDLAKANMRGGWKQTGS